MPGDTRQLPGDNVCPQLPPPKPAAIGPRAQLCQPRGGVSAAPLSSAHARSGSAEAASAAAAAASGAGTDGVRVRISVSWRCTSWVAKAQAPAAAAQDSAPEGAWGGGDRGARRDMISPSQAMCLRLRNAVSRGRARLVAHLCIFKKLFLN